MIVYRCDLCDEIRDSLGGLAAARTRNGTGTVKLRLV
jgi:hypothetical protein